MFPAGAQVCFLGQYGCSVENRWSGVGAKDGDKGTSEEATAEIRQEAEVVTIRRRWEQWRQRGVGGGLCAKSLQLSDSVRPHRRQPIRLPHPWDSPGKESATTQETPVPFLGWEDPLEKA